MNCMYGKPKEGKKALFLMLIPSHLKRFGTCGTSSRTNTNIMNCTRAFMKPFQKRELRNHVEKHSDRLLFKNTHILSVVFRQQADRQQTV